MKASVAILGAGALGRAVGRILKRSALPFRIWSRGEETRAKARKSLGKDVVVDSVAAAAEGAAAVLIAVPAPAMRNVCGMLGDVATGDQVVVHACRGVAEEFTLPHQVVRQETCVRKIGALGGPLHAVELTSGRPLAVVLASRFDETGELVSRLMAKTPVKVSPSRDIVGVEIAGAISNVTALAVGIADGLGLGETERGVLMMRGLTEAGLLGRALGASRRTFAGLAGVGDLIPRRVTATERHRKLGKRIGEDDSIRESLADFEDLEGVVSAREAAHLAKRLELSLPLVEAVALVLSGAASPSEALDSVLRLDLELDGTLGGER